MRVGIMQPYFFPYIGYWQLINAVDRYVICDDVNYIKGGWINRNYILVNGRRKRINLRLSKASQNKLINEIELLCDEVYYDKLLKTIEFSYKKAPYFNEVFPLINSIIKHDEKNLAKYLAHSIQEVCKYLGIDTRLIISSELDKNNSLRRQYRIIEICKLLNADQYINAIGGIELYSRDDFLAHGIDLKFLKTREIKYQQFNKEFIPNLSIIDILMFNSVEETKKLLGEYDLITN